MAKIYKILCESDRIEEVIGTFWDIDDDGHLHIYDDGPDDIVMSFSSMHWIFIQNVTPISKETYEKVEAARRYFEERNKSVRGQAAAGGRSISPA